MYKKNMFIEFENIANLGIMAGISTRNGGVSSGNYKSLNLGIYTNDQKESISKNYEIFLESLNLRMNKTFYTLQVHGTDIKIIDEKFYADSSDFSAIENFDGMISKLKNINLVTFYADCVPLLFYDKKNDVIGICHSGWRGSVKKIALKMVELFIGEFNSNPLDIICAIGPCASVCCYEVDSVVIKEVNKNFKFPHKYYMLKNNNKYMLDLKKMNYDILVESGILKENIEISPLCTICNNDILFSYRKENGKTGRHIGIISK
ncbi:peptidoglycan editing factor PgeF [Helicovermis profundi]|uniref:Purine nucleoside phosphorylase n=1 Tax=Helicovermis profundi TaxID=3065157 RepID=A0AAU9E4B2_9FIRM|nr:peptidoglycan editing factor PgeF [Clostridia bacterium S502]